MNVNLWFARDEQNEIVGIYNANKDNKYHCPICNSDVIPKALDSKKVSPHFAHIDMSKCNSETMLHWWFKHKFIDIGDTFTISTDKEISYKCIDFETEVTFNLDSGLYNPDLVVYTECGETVVFEMANTNKKQVKDYIDMWIELDRVVVEVDIKSLVSNERDTENFKALYYKGKCFNFNKRDDGYYNIIGKMKEEMKSKNHYDIELAKRLDWLWSEIAEFKKLNKTSEELETAFIIVFEEINSSNLINTFKKHKDDEVKEVLDRVIHLYNKKVYEKSKETTIEIQDLKNKIMSEFNLSNKDIKLIKDTIYESYTKVYWRGNKRTVYNPVIGYEYEIIIFINAKEYSFPISNIVYENGYCHLLNAINELLITSNKK